MWGESEFTEPSACVFFSRALRFWNQILTLCSVTLKEDDKSLTSDPDRYWVWRNLASSAASWDEEKGILGFLSSLCRREPFRVFDPGKMKDNHKILIAESDSDLMRSINW